MSSFRDEIEVDGWKVVFHIEIASNNEYGGIARTGQRLRRSSISRHIRYADLCFDVLYGKCQMWRMGRKLPASGSRDEDTGAIRSAGPELKWRNERGRPLVVCCGFVYHGHSRQFLLLTRLFLLTEEVFSQSASGVYWMET